MIKRNTLSFFLYPTSELEILRIINNLKSKTSSGYDHISNKLLKEIKFELLEPLTIIFNKSLTEGVFPEYMKSADIVPLFKNKDKANKTNYRPISLLVTISKILEKIIYSRTYSFLDNNSLLYISQYGFRKKHSCEHAVGELVEQVVKNLAKKQYTASVFIDLSKAFDTLEHTTLLNKLDQYGIRGLSNNWYKSYLENRSLRVKCVDSCGNVVYSV